MTDTPKVWIGCLAAYNQGDLHGEWVDATDADEMQEGLTRVLESSPVSGAEEWFIADYDGFGAATSSLGEYADFEDVARIGALIEEHGEEFLAYLEFRDSPEEATEEGFQSARRGAWDSERDYVMEVVGEIGLSGVPAIVYGDGWGGDTEKNRIKVFDELSGYLDWDAIARAHFDHGEYSYVNGYVFEEGMS